MGLLQALERLDVNLYENVGLETYYQGLTLHGVALALVFTFTLRQRLPVGHHDEGLQPAAGQPGGVERCRCTAPGSASPWPPGRSWPTRRRCCSPSTRRLQATPAFYIGAVLLVISTWLVLLNMLLTLRAWRRDNRGERIPLHGLRQHHDLPDVVRRLARHRHRGAGVPHSRGRWASPPRSTRSSPARCSGSPATRSSTSGCCRSTCQLVHDAAEAGGREALQRRPDPDGVHRLPAADPGRRAPPVHRPRHPLLVEDDPVAVDLRHLLPERRHPVHDVRRAGDGGPGKRGGTGSLAWITQAAVGQPGGLGSAARRVWRSCSAGSAA